MPTHPCGTGCPATNRSTKVRPACHRAWGRTEQRSLDRIFPCTKPRHNHVPALTAQGTAVLMRRITRPQLQFALRAHGESVFQNSRKSRSSWPSAQPGDSRERGRPTWHTVLHDSTGAWLCAYLNAPTEDLCNGQQVSQQRSARPSGIAIRTHDVVLLAFSLISKRTWGHVVAWFPPLAARSGRIAYRLLKNRRKPGMS